jgi:muramoyltetrapeptide carboxypeptidase
MNKKHLKTVGVIAPSRPVYTRQTELSAGLEILKGWGVNTILSKNLHVHDYYSAGTKEQRANDVNQIFANNDVDIVICATGGITSNQILNLLDYKKIKENPKPLIGYSDNTNLLFAIYKKTGRPTYYGPDICELHNLNQETLESYRSFLQKSKLELPSEFSIIKEGKGSGKLIGGNLFAICGLLSTNHLPKLSGEILFWEDCRMSPAHIDFHLNELKLSGKIEKLSGMVIGHLEECIDKKYSQDNKPLKEIVNCVFEDYNFPVIQVNYFGHEINNFQIIPIGFECFIDTNKKVFALTHKASTEADA